MDGGEGIARHERRRVGWLSLAQLITWGSVFYTFALLLEPVERELGLTRAQASVGFSIALLAEGLLAYPVGRWIDRGHERAVMTGGSLMVAALLFAHSFVAGIAGFYGVWALLGAALAATLYSPVFAVVTRRYPKDFRRAIITMTFLGGLASTVFLPLSAFLIRELGWRHALWVLAAVHLLVCAPLHAWWLRDAPGPAAMKAAAGAGAGPGPLRMHLRSAPFLLLGVFVVVMMAVTAAIPPHLVQLLREQGLPEAWVIALPAAVGAVQVFGRALLYFFEHHFDVHSVNRLIVCLVPLGLLVLLASGSSVAAGLVFALLYGLGNGMQTIVKGTAMALYVSREHMATLNGALGIPTALARAAAPLALGVMWTEQAGYRHGLWLLLAVSIVGLAAFVLAQGAAQRRATA